MIKGSCLCGSVTFAVSGRVTPIQYCHCSRCRKATGGAFMAALAAKTGTFQWTTGEPMVATYVAPVRETPPAYRHTFCSACGSPLPLYDAAQPYVVIPAGCLDDDPGTRPFRQIFVAIKAPWYEIHDALPQFAAGLPPELRLPRKSD